MRTEPATNKVYDYRTKKDIENLPELRERVSTIIDNYHNAQQDILETYVDRGQLRDLAQPTVLDSGKRIPGLKLDHPRLLALMHALVRFANIAAGGTFRTIDLYVPTLEALGASASQYSLASLRYGLSKLRAKKLVEKVPRTRRYRLIGEGYSICLVFLKLFEKIYAPLTAGLLKPFPGDRKLAEERRAQLDRLYQAVAHDLNRLVASCWFEGGSVIANNENKILVVCRITATKVRRRASANEKATHQYPSAGIRRRKSLSGAPRVLTPYRRHTRSCRYFDAPNPQEFTRCNCPICCYGVLGGEEVRRSLKMRDWKRALEKTDRWNKSPDEAGPVVTVKDAGDAFIRNRQIRKMTASTIASHQKTFVHLVRFCGPKPMASVTLDMLTRFQESRIFTPNKKGSQPRPIQPSTFNKELKSLRALFAFARKRKWCEDNVAGDLEHAGDDGLPTLPFDSDEVRRILEACEHLDDDNPLTRDLNRHRTRARILLMLYTGFRISDTVRLERKRVDLRTGKLLIKIMKTRRPMYASLPAAAIDALKTLPEDSPYFFWLRRSREVDHRCSDRVAT